MTVRLTGGLSLSVKCSAAGFHLTNVTDVGTNVGINVGVNVGTNEEKLLILLKQDGTLTAKVLAGTLGITQRQVERMIARWKKEGVLVRHGASKNGFWEVKSE